MKQKTHYSYIIEWNFSWQLFGLDHFWPFSGRFESLVKIIKSKELDLDSDVSENSKPLPNNQAKHED